MKSRIISTDDIAIMPDDELSRRLSSLTGYIERERRRGARHAELEIEHSYLAREVEIRVKRKEAHERWIKTNPYRTFDEEMYS